MIKIAILSTGKMPIPAFEGGAIETLVTHILNENLINDKMDITVFTTKHEKHDKYPQNNNIKFKFYSGDNYLNKLFYQVSRIIRKLMLNRVGINTNFCKFCIKEIKKDNYDYVIVEGDYFQVVQLKKKLNCKIIYHEHTDLVNKNNALSNKIIDSCEFIIVVSEFLKKRIEEVNKSKPVYVLKNCIDMELFKEKDIDLFRQKYFKENNILNSDYLIVYCGRLDHNKGIDYLVEAMDYLDQKYKLIVIGNSWFNNNFSTSFVENLKEKAKKNINRIYFTGYLKQEEIVDYYNMADICVFPSICNEAAGLVILESLACGTPVIVSKIGGMPEYAPLESAYFLNLEDKNNFANEIANVILKVNKKGEDYLNKKVNARKSVLEYSKDNYYNNLVKILEGDKNG